MHARTHARTNARTHAHVHTQPIGEYHESRVERISVENKPDTETTSQCGRLLCEVDYQNMPPFSILAEQLY